MDENVVNVELENSPIASTTSTGAKLASALRIIRPLLTCLHCFGTVALLLFSLIFLIIGAAFLGAKDTVKGGILAGVGAVCFLATLILYKIARDMLSDMTALVAVLAVVNAEPAEREALVKEIPKDHKLRAPTEEAVATGSMEPVEAAVKEEVLDVLISAVYDQVQATIYLPITLLLLATFGLALAALIVDKTFEMAPTGVVMIAIAVVLALFTGVRWFKKCDILIWEPLFVLLVCWFITVYVVGGVSQDARAMRQAAIIASVVAWFVAPISSFCLMLFVRLPLDKAKRAIVNTPALKLQKLAVNALSRIEPAKLRPTRDIRLIE